MPGDNFVPNPKTDFVAKISNELAELLQNTSTERGAVAPMSAYAGTGVGQEEASLVDGESLGDPLAETQNTVRAAENMRSHDSAFREEIARTTLRVLNEALGETDIGMDWDIASGEAGVEGMFSAGLAGFHSGYSYGGVTLISDMSRELRGVGADGASVFLSLPSDTLFSQQWHLNQSVGWLFDLGDLSSVWDDYTGDGVLVAVIDDAVQRAHHQLDDNYSISLDWDFENGDTNPTGVDGDNHGTAVAGIIGAARDGVGTVGVAYGATIFGMSIGPFINDHFIDTMIASLSSVGGYAAGAGYIAGHQGDVANMSLGTQYTGNWFDDALSTTKMNNLETAIDYAAANGRGGLGVIMVKSAGNARNTNPGDGGNIGHDANASSWNANIHTISVAAVDQGGFVSSYSSHGANILISGFGSPSAGQVVTTDRLGAEGYNSGANPDYTFGFNGTSAAAPMVTGVVALMLEANSSLGWRDVQEILAYSARHVGSAVDGVSTAGSEEYAWDWNGAVDWNGGGLHFSNDYGFGLVDAFAAVRMAETWQTSNTSANDVTTFNDVLNATQTLTGSNVADSFVFTPNSVIRIEHVTVDISFTQWHDMGDLDIVLIAPDGTEIHLIDNIGEDDGTSAGGFGSGRWTFSSPGLMGMLSSGSWTLVLRDADSSIASPITVNDIDIRFHGAASSTSAQFIFTNEFSDFAGVGGHGTSFAGGSTGTDTLNAAAVTSNTLIDLSTNSGIIDGVAITNSHIQRVYTGDGNDTIQGDAFSEYLDGGRGNDVITGGVANETIVGGAGNDRLIGGAGDDSLLGGAGNDTLSGGTGNDALDGGDGDDIFLFENGEGADADFLDGGLGHDKIRLGGAGVFNFTGAFNTTSIEEIEFNADGAGVVKTLLLGNKELDGASEFLNVLIDGNANVGSVDTVDITLNFTNNLDLSGWTFQDWSSQDHIIIHGNASANNVLGSSQNDEIFGNDGNDSLSGATGNDTIDGGNGNDSIDGGVGNDSLIGGEGLDTIQGGDGDDVLSGGGGEDSMDGGAGIDTADFSHWGGSGVYNLEAETAFFAGFYTETIANFENLIASQGNDTITGSSGDNILEGQAGNDSIDGGGGNDTIHGGAGNDTIEGGSGVDVMNGDAGDDTFIINLGWTGGAGESINGGTGTDTFDTSAVGTMNATVNLTAGTFTYLPGGSGFIALSSIENVITGAGNDVLIGSLADNVLDGGAGNDTLYGGNGTDTLTGGAGLDRLFGDAGNDVLDGGADADYVHGGEGIDTLLGGTGNDTLDGASGADRLFGEAGNDALIGGADSGADYLDGGTGNDTLEGGGGNDTLVGGDDNDVLLGGDGNDGLYGQAGNDLLEGGAGADFLHSGSGDDTLDGGTGNDTLSATNGADDIIFRVNGGSDIVDDFTNDIDQLLLDQALWGGGLNAQQVVNAFALVSGGDLYFDFGGGDQIMLRNYTNILDLADDLVLI